MDEEMCAHKENHTWTLVSRKHNMNIVGSKWVFKSMLKLDETLNKLKSHLVARGFNQKEGVDFHKIFTSVIRPTTI